MVLTRGAERVGYWDWMLHKGVGALEKTEIVKCEKNVKGRNRGGIMYCCTAS